MSGELYPQIVDSVMRGILDGFRELWDRPDGPAILEAFADRRMAFTVTRDHIEIRQLPGSQN